MFGSSFRPASDKNGNGHGHGEVLLQTEAVEAEFQRIKTGIHRELIDSLDLSKITGLSDAELRDDIRRLAEGMLVSRSRKLPAIDEDRLVEELIAESFGLGPLEPYMQDPDVSDILVNGPHEVYVERLGRLQETNTVFADEEHLLQIIQRVVARIGRRIDEHSPMVDARLPDGSRVNAIIAPLALHGPVLSIRRFGHRPLQTADLLVRGSVCPEILKVLEAAIEARINIMISGGTGSGKTTLLNNLSKFIPGNERLVTIEDSAELLLQRKHVVKLETRPKSAEGTAEVSQRDLVRNALRMRPDRIILGEVRGGEALDMLQAMNTGHEGSLTTIHANDTRDALSRLEVMVSMAGFDLPVAVTRRYIASAITLIVHLARLKGGVRRVMRVSEITALENGDYAIQDLFGFRQTGLDDRGIARGHFFATGQLPAFSRRLLEQGIDLSPKLFEARQLTADSAIGPLSAATNPGVPAVEGIAEMAELAIAGVTFATVATTLAALGMFVRDLFTRPADPAARQRLEFAPAEPSGEINGWFFRLVEESGTVLDHGGALAVVVGAGVVGLAIPLFLFENLLAAAGGMLAGAAIPILYLSVVRWWRLGKMRSALPYALQAVADAVRGGQTLSEACELVSLETKGPLGKEFGYAHSQLELGHSPISVMNRMVRRVPLPEFRIFATAVIVHRRAGGNLSLLTERMSKAAHDKQDVRNHMLAVTAGSRLSAIGMVIGAFIAAALLCWIEPDYIDAFLGNPKGPWLLATAVILQTIGGIWVWRILKN